MGRVFWEEAAREGAGLHPGRCSQLKTYRSCTKGLRDGMGETEEQQGVACSLAEVWCPSNSFNAHQIWEDGSLLSISVAGQGLRGHWKEERRKGGKETFLPLFLGALLDYCGGGLVANSRPTLAIPWTVACQAPLSMGFSRQEYWGGLPFPSPLDYCTYKKNLKIVL